MTVVILLAAWACCLPPEPPLEQTAAPAVEQQDSAAPVFRFNDGKPLRTKSRDGVTVVTLPPLLDIGRGKLHLVEGAWPAKLILRTKAPSLEGFGRTDPAEDVTIRRVGKYLEIDVPAAWYAEKPRALPLIWVDYFRN